MKQENLKTYAKFMLRGDGHKRGELRRNGKRNICMRRGLVCTTINQKWKRGIDNMNSDLFQAAPNGKKMLTLIGIYTGVLGTLLLATGLAVMLPAAALEIGGTDIYPLANSIGGPIGVSLLPLYGYLAARNPAIKRLLFSISMLIGAVVIILYGIANSMWSILVASMIWGAPIAAVFGLGFAMIREMYDIKKAGIYLGFVGTIMSVGMLAGPTLTGLFIDQLSWRAVCHAFWPIMVLSAILVFLGLRVTKEEARPFATPAGKFDFVGAMALVVFLTGLIFFLSFGASFIPFGTPLSWILLVVAAIGLVALILIIRKKGNDAFIPAPVLKDRNTLWLTICNFLFLFSSMAVSFFMPTYVLYVMGGTATEASLTVTLIAVAGLFLGPFIGRMIAKSGNARSVITAGTIVRIVVTALLYLLLSPTLPLWILYVLMLIAGIYNSQQSVTFSAAPQIQIKPELRMLGNSVIQMIQNLAAAVSVAIYTMVIVLYGVADGMKISLILALITAALGLLGGLMLKKLPTNSEEQGGGNNHGIT
jgi:MFS family permease